jgi:hypothetical protein
MAIDPAAEVGFALVGPATAGWSTIARAFAPVI